MSNLCQIFWPTSYIFHLLRPVDVLDRWLPMFPLDILFVLVLL